MRVLPKTISTALGLILLAGGIGAAHADRRPTTSTTSTTSTADPIQTTTPECLTPDQTTNDAAVEGRRAYMRMNCYSCHGSNGHNGGMGPSLIGAADDVAEAVPNGEDGGMPAFKNNLCANDIANLKAYIQLLNTGTEPTFVNWWEPGPNPPSM